MLVLVIDVRCILLYYILYIYYIYIILLLYPILYYTLVSSDLFFLPLLLFSSLTLFSLSFPMQSGSAFGHLPGWTVKSFIVKAGDDLRKELLAMQVIRTCTEIFAEAQLPLWLRPYEARAATAATPPRRAVLCPLCAQQPTRPAFPPPPRRCWSPPPAPR